MKTPLYANAIYLMLANIAYSLFGFVFWILAARFYSPKDVGLASAIISSSGLLTMLAGLGLGYGILRFLPSSQAPHKMINTGFSISGMLALAAAVIFILGLSVWSPALLFIRENPFYFAIFVISVSIAALAGLIDQSFMAKRQARFVLGRSIIFNILRLALPIGYFGAFGIFGAFGFATIFSLAAAILFFLPRTSPGYQPKITFDRQTIKQIVPYSFINYISDLFWSIPSFLLPLLVVNLLGPENNAYFFIAWSMAGILYLIPAAMATSLIAEGSHDQDTLWPQAWRALKMTFLLLIPAVVLMLLLANKFLLIYGTEYAQKGTILLRWLAIAALPLAINSLFFSVKRVQIQLKPVIIFAAFTGLSTLVISYVLLHKMDVSGVGISWLVSQSITAIILSLYVMGWKR